MIHQKLTQRGFSLLEVIVAFAIGAAALGLFAQIFGQGSRNLAVSSDYAVAVDLADSLLAEYTEADDLTPLAERGATADYEWQVAISPYGAPPPAVESHGEVPIDTDMRLLRVEVTVSWQRFGRRRSITSSSLRIGMDYAPPPTA